MWALPDPTTFSTSSTSLPRLDQENRRCHHGRHALSGDQLPCKRQNASSIVQSVERCLTLVSLSLKNTFRAANLSCDVTGRLQLTMASGPCGLPRHNARL